MAENKVSPEIGRAALLAFLKEKSPLGPLKILANHLGYFFQIPLPMFKPYVVFGAQANKKVLVTERDKVLWRNTDPVTDLLGQGVLIVDGDEHDHYRKLMEPALHTSRLPEYTASMISQTDRVSSQWRDGEVVDMLVESRKIALLIIMQTLFSKDVWDDLEKIWKPVLKSIEYISPGAWILWRKIPRFGFRKPLKVLDDYLFQIITDRRRQTEDGLSSTVHRPNDLLQHLIGAGLSDKIIRDQMLTMLIAGHDTSTALLAWTFALLGQHPEIHQQVVNEIDKTNDLERVPLLDNVIKESLRLYPPIHIGNRRIAQEMDFDGNKIPKDERLFYSIYLTHRDENVWENAESFCPERFSNGKKPAGLSYVPFGGGPRVCIGATFGQVEARVVLSYLLKNFTFKFTNHKIHPHMGATLEPRPGVMMKVTRRSRL
ncbi:MAG: cytochrome P450 [Anaerolineales bacterium]|nr:cytochrome P450 [Anaerolineales bacterium]